MIADNIDVIKIKGEEYYLIPKKNYSNELLHRISDKEEAYKAVDILTLGEYEASRVIFKDIKESKCIVNLSKIANKNNIAKSLVTVALRKLKIAGIIDTASRGPQGVDITICNEEFLKIIQET